jgi:polysaccharide export outer membrane protein
VKVQGLTTQQIKDKLVELISKDVDDPIVRVELMNFRVNVLGEVQRPGAVSVKRERYSVLDALADAGDLTEFGERSNVLLIREENGVKIYHRLNLNEASVLSSPYFYMQQNDVIYVEPNEIRKDNSKYNQNNAFKLSVISTIVSACSVIASLVIALTVK